MSWLDAFFQTGYKTIAVAGVAVAQEAILNIVSGASVADNPGFGRTDMTIVGATFPTVHEVVDANINLNDAGNSYVGFSGLSVDRTGFLIATPTPGQTATFADEDGSLAAHNYIINGNGKNIVFNGAGAATLTFGHSTSPFGAYDTLTIQYNGTFWKVL
jgi:hypothetical protein